MGGAMKDNILLWGCTDTVDGFYIRNGRAPEGLIHSLLCTAALRAYNETFPEVGDWTLKPVKDDPMGRWEFNFDVAMVTKEGLHSFRDQIAKAKRAGMMEAVRMMRHDANLLHAAGDKGPMGAWFINGTADKIEEKIRKMP